MKRKNWIIPLTLGATAATILIGAGAYAKGQGFKAMHGGIHQERPSFSELDADGDGNLTVAEMQAHAAARFNSVDANGDGVISADESATAAAEKAIERTGMMFAKLLEWRDSDGDGALSQLEMGDNRGERMFSRVDADGDGVISAEEYEQAQDRGHRGGRMGPKGSHSNRQGG